MHTGQLEPTRAAWHLGSWQVSQQLAAETAREPRGRSLWHRQTLQGTPRRLTKHAELEASQSGASSNTQLLSSRHVSKANHAEPREPQRAEFRSHCGTVVARALAAGHVERAQRAETAEVRQAIGADGRAHQAQRGEPGEARQAGNGGVADGRARDQLQLLQRGGARNVRQSNFSDNFARVSARAGRHIYRQRTCGRCR